MLLLLSLVHILATSGRPLPGHPLNARGEPVSCNDINSCRTFFGIVSGCLATVFACTWVSVHPNVPPPNQGQLALTWRRFWLMVVAVIAPEIMVGFAARQFLDARWFSKKYGVSRTHGFFFTMGGFVLRSGHHPIVMEDQLSKHPEYVTAIKNIKAGDIEDKSKGDTLSKGLALLQGLWFMAQCLARICQNIPVTELEVATLAFQFLNILIWLLWWHKPLDVQRPILIGSGNEFVKDTSRSGCTFQERYFVDGDGIILGEFFDFNPASSTSVHPFWSTHGLSDAPLFVVILALFSAAFGAIHCAAWNAPFPSVTEMWMWRSCSLTIGAIPLVLALISWEYLYGRRGLQIREVIHGIIFSIYIGARLVLIVLSFTTLRALPPGAFVDVNWSMFIPHIGL